MVYGLDELDLTCLTYALINHNSHMDATPQTQVFRESLLSLVG